MVNWVQGVSDAIDRVVAGEALLLRLPVYDGPREIGGGGASGNVSSG